MMTLVFYLVSLNFQLQIQMGFSQPLGINSDDERCRGEDYAFILKSLLDSKLSDLEKRLEEESQKIQNLETQIKRLTNCPQGWNKHGKSCYKLNKRKLTRTAANQFCRNLSARLAEIGTKSENDFINNIITNNSGTDRAWLGGVDMAKEGTWIWSFSDIPLTFQNWDQGEPNNDNGNEDCLEILGTRYGRWNDNVCSNSIESVCEKDL